MGRVKELQIEMEQELSGTFSVFDESMARANELPETKGYHRLTKEHKQQYDTLIKDMQEFWSLLEDYTRGEIV